MAVDFGKVLKTIGNINNPLSQYTDKLFQTWWNKETGEAERTANEQNIAFQREVNAQQQYNLEHAHQIEVADLDAAGLNPWLSVGGGAQQANLSTAQVQPVEGGGMLNALTALAMMAVLKGFLPKGTSNNKWWKSLLWKK